ncbi:RHS repeat-associated core domain-containing protein [Amycolatopsis magusensis]|uniref:RHS repeat-associated core domain-containing protein n=1 Tax=Amycolatopsis magusensis TaxID=882444 RepID=UPI003C2F4876
MSNPLVAEAKDDTKAYTGIPLLESVNETSQAISSGDWAGGVLGAVGTAMDAAAAAMDPFGAILAAGVGWLMEHVGPLSDALDALAGNPDEIKAHSETWKNVAGELTAISADLAKMVAEDTASWTGPGGDAYRSRGTDTATLLTAAQSAATGASDGIGTAGTVVDAVRTLVRDIIAELVGHMISWALQVLFTLGIGLAWVVPQVVAAVAKTATKIATITKKLVQAMSKLSPLLKKLGDSFDDAAKALKNIKSSKVDAPPPVRDGGGTPRGGGDTSPSGTPGPPPPGPKGPDQSTTPGSASPTPTPTPTPPPPAPKGPDTTPDTTPSGAGPSPTPPPPKPAPKPDSTTPAAAKPDPPRDTAVPGPDRNCKSDPIDIATGEMILEQVDLDLPDLLRIERTHVSSYRAGQFFGPSWASTVDQRLELDADSACYFSPDGMILVYPLPSAAGPVLPVEGPRRPLRATADGGYQLTDPRTGHTLHFRAHPASGRNRLPLHAITDRVGNRVDLEYRGEVPARLVHSDGRQVAVDAEDGRVTAIRMLDPERDGGVLVAGYGYDGDRRLTEVVNSSGRPLRFDYDTDGRVTGWQDRNGTWYRYVYDADGRCVRTVGADGFLDGAFAYDRERLVTTYTDAVGNTSVFELNEANQTLREIDPLGNATRFEWDRYDRLLARTDPLDRTTRYEYDDDGTLLAIIRPDGTLVGVSQDDDVLTITVEQNGRIWRRAYPGDTDPLSASVGVAGTFDPGQAEPGAAGGVRHDRDLFGRTTLVTDAVGGRSQLGWTVEGKRSWRLDAAGAREQWRYDSEGNEVEHVDALGQVTRREYGAFGLLAASVDQTGARTTYGYDREFRLTSVTDPRGLVWHYTYDAAGRVVQEVDFDGRVLRFAYDAAGQLVRSVNALGEVTEYAYDLLGNAIERRTPTGNTTYTYDPVGRLAAAANPDSVLIIERDEDGRVLAETVNGRTVSFSYTEDGRGMRRRTPSGVDSTWSYDEAGNPVSLATSGHLLRFGHDAAGRETERRLDNTVVFGQSFDAAHRLTSQAVTTQAGGIVQQRRYGYRPDGKLTGVQDSATGEVRFQLDAAGRVTEVTAPDRRESYRYDPAGNIAGSTGGAEGGPRQYTGNVLTRAGAVSYQYDAQGRLVARRCPNRAGGEDVWQYTWDSLDRMTAVITPDGTRWCYRYDPLGRRIAKQRLAPGPDGRPVVAEEVLFSWDGAAVVEQVHRGGDGRHQVLTWDHHPHEDRPLTQSERQVRPTGEQVDQRFHAIVTDLIGTPTELVGGDGSVAWRRRSTLWGKVLPAPGAGTPLRFPGQYEDAETGLHYNVYRYYDPATGRYASQDPLGLRPAPNPVAYVGNPLSAADPLGLTSPTCGPDTSTSNVPPRGGANNDPANVGNNSPGSTNPSSSNPKLVRRDDNFPSETNPSGIRKSHLDADGNLVPANPNGATTPREHVLGGKRKEAKANSPYTSFSVEGGDGKVYGGQEIKIDHDKLQADIASGKVKDVEVLSPQKVQDSIQENLDKTAGRKVDVDLKPNATPQEVQKFVDDQGLSKGKSKKLLEDVQAMLNTRRDEEWLIKGVVPKQYIDGPANA